MPFQPGFRGKARPPLALSRTDGKTGTGTSWAGVSFGAAYPGRIIVVGAVGRRGDTASCGQSSCTIGGIAATLVGKIEQHAYLSCSVGLWAIQNDSLLSGTVAVGYASAPSNAGIGVYRLTDALWNVYSADTDTIKPMSITVANQAGGANIGVYCAANYTQGATWTSLVQDYAAGYISTASAKFAAASGGRDCKGTLVVAGEACAVASWSPVYAP